MTDTPPAADSQFAELPCAPFPDESVELQLLQRLRAIPELFQRIGELPADDFKRQTILRKEFPAELVPAALTLFELRKKGSEKFSRAEQMWFERTTLEQATAESIARHKARRFGDRPVCDLCCGVGGDALALAARGPVTAFDLSAAVGLRLCWNAEIYDVAMNLEFLQRDVQARSNWPGLVHIDPDRRAKSEQRAQRIEDYQPGLPYLLDLIANTAGGAIKLGPASNFGGKFTNMETELISLHGECKEATIWYGELAGSEIYRATALPSGETIAAHPLSAAVPITPLGRFLFDPDPAVVRAGLVDVVAERLHLTRLDDAEEFLTGDALVHSAFVTAFEVLAELPNNDRELRHFVRQVEWGQVEIKCRHVPVNAEQMRKKLPLTGTGAGVILVARVQGRTKLIAARRVVHAGV